jgi:hypothetical protein
MRHTDQEHIIRAAGSITGDNEIMVFGSRTILGQLPKATLEEAFYRAFVAPLTQPHQGARDDRSMRLRMFIEWF